MKCKKKNRYKKESDVIKLARQCDDKRHCIPYWYKCGKCGRFHLATVKGKKR